MKKKNVTDILNENIVVLQLKRNQELQELKNQYYTTYDSLNPINLVKNAVVNFATSPGVKTRIIGGVLGFATNFITKKFNLNNSTSPIKKIVGNVINLIASNIKK